MKKSVFTVWAMAVFMAGQTQQYPEPEFTNEVYFLKKEDTIRTLVRLEKGSSKMDTKTKMGGLGGSESGYNLEGEQSPVRLENSNQVSFVFSKGKSGQSSMNSSPQKDSMMRANGIDSKMMEQMEEMNDPIKMITLYKVDVEKKTRKILMQKNPGAMPFGSKKIKTSDKYSFSVKKIREGYYELVVDKPLKRGEYAFTYTDYAHMGTSMEATIFAFGID